MSHTETAWRKQLKVAHIATLEMLPDLDMAWHDQHRPKKETQRACESGAQKLYGQALSMSTLPPGLIRKADTPIQTHRVSGTRRTQWVNGNPISTLVDPCK